MHLDTVYFAPFETRGCGALCACSARANISHLLLFPVPTDQTVGTADAKLTGHMYVTPTYMLLWLPFLWGADCARQGRKSLFARGPPVLGNLDLLTPNLIHRWNSSSVIRLHMSFRDMVQVSRISVVGLTSLAKFSSSVAVSR